MSAKTIFARVTPESVRLTETYFFDRVISRNQSNRPSEEPTGQIGVIVPYDGYKHFTRDGFQDVEEAVQQDESLEPIQAQIGHLLLSDYARTNLSARLDLNDRYGAVPLQIPIRGGGIDSVEQLRNDQHAAVLSFHYAPQNPEIIPISVEMELLDEDTLGWSLPTGSQQEDTQQLGDVVAQIARQVNFSRNLILVTRVRVDLPRRLDPNNSLKPTITRMSLGWPTITSFHALNLRVGANEQPFMYNPVKQALEWTDVPLRFDSAAQGTEVATYASDEMTLLIEQPGELYQQPRLDGQVEVCVSGILLSGLQVRLFNSRGITSQPQPQLTTRLVSDFHLVLDDAFMRRKRSVYQHLHFNELIPDKMRIADIRTALIDRSFRTEQEKDIDDRDELRHIIVAKRSEGPDVLTLQVYVEGKRYATERQTQVPGGQTYTSTFESGELNVYLRGEFPGDSRVLVNELNAFQVALRDRFERLRAKR